MNIVILHGRLSADPVLRTLPSGQEVMDLQVSIGRTDGPADSVPVVRHDPSAAHRRLAADDHVVVVGRVQRRFFRAGGALASRTEVVAADMVRATETARVGRVLAAAVSAVTPP